MGIIEDLKRLLADPEKKSTFIDQIRKETELVETLRSMGLTVSAEDVRDRARERPHEILSKSEKIDQIDKIVEVTVLKTLETLKVLEVLQKIEKINPSDSKNVVIDEITLIKEIREIRDLTWAPRSIIQNPLFDQDFAGWLIYGNPEIIQDVYFKYCKFPPLIAQHITQYFPIPIAVDSLTDFYVILKSSILATDVLYVFCYYTDQNFTAQYFQVSDVTKWEKKTITPTANKYIEQIMIGTLSSYNSTTRLKQIITVF